MIFPLSLWERVGGIKAEEISKKSILPLVKAKALTLTLSQRERELKYWEEEILLAIKLMRTGAKKRPSYRIVVKEKQSKRDGAYLEKLGTYDPTREPAEINLNSDRVRYWIEKGAQPTDTVRRLIKQSAKAQSAAAESQAEAA